MLAGAAGAVAATVVVVVLVLPGGSGANGLATTYNCNGIEGIETIHFTSTGNAHGSGINGTMTATDGTTETFVNGSIVHHGLYFGSDAAPSESGPLVANATVEANGLLLQGANSVCTPG